MKVAGIIFILLLAISFYWSNSNKRVISKILYADNTESLHSFYRTKISMEGIEIDFANAMSSLAKDKWGPLSIEKAHLLVIIFSNSTSLGSTHLYINAKSVDNWLNFFFLEDERITVAKLIRDRLIHEQSFQASPDLKRTMLTLEDVLDN